MHHPHEGATRIFVMVALIGAVSLLTQGTPPKVAPPAPSVGRTAAERDLGLRPWGRPVPRVGDEGVVRALARVLAAEGLRIPEGAREVRIHRHAGQLPPSDGEEGPPWHVTVQGMLIKVGARGRSGLPSVPQAEGSRADLRRCVHVGVPFSGQLDAAGEITLRRVQLAIERLMMESGGRDE